MLIPPITQLPLFVGFSMVLNRASHPPTVLDSESFLTLTSLSHSDPTLTIPIVVGLITLANVETARWFASAAATQRQAKVDEWVKQRREKGEMVLEPGRIVQSSLRFLSVARIIIAALVPGVSLSLTVLRAPYLCVVSEYPSLLGFLRGFRSRSILGFGLVACTQDPDIPTVITCTGPARLKVH